MEFDKSKVYTALNADELKVGSNVYVADNIDALKQYVEDDWATSTIICIMPECYRGRFRVDGYDYTFALAYLVSEPEEKKLKWTDLKIGDVIRRKGEIRMITGISTVSDSFEMHIFNGTNWLTDEELAEWEKVDYELEEYERRVEQ